MAAIIPFIVSLIGGFVSKQVIVAMLKRAAVAIGISAVTYTGIGIGMAHYVQSIDDNINGLPLQVIAMLQLMHLPQAFNVLFSSYAGALAVKGLTAAGVITRMGVSTPGQVFSPGTF